MLVNNHHLHIETYGPETGHPVIFLHHGLGSTRAWQRQIGPFTEAGYHVILYDRWGYGQSDARPYLNVPSFEDDLADLEGLLSTFNLQPVTLVGHSDGGTIALYYAAQNPDRVVALVTIAAHIYLDPEMEPSILEIKQAFENDLRFRKGLQRAHGENFESTFYNWFNGWHIPEALEWDMRPLLGKIQCPALVIQGEEDEYATPQHAIDIVDTIPKAQLWLVLGAKHMLPQEMAETFNEKVLRFISSRLLVENST